MNPIRIAGRRANVIDRRPSAAAVKAISDDVLRRVFIRFGPCASREESERMWELLLECAEQAHSHCRDALGLNAPMPALDGSRASMAHNQIMADR